MSTANDRQVAGSHYNASTQHWDYAVRALSNRYLEGNITKYVLRHRKKNGLQDLDKAMHYMDKLIEEFQAYRVAPHLQGDRSFPMHTMIEANGLNNCESFILRRLAAWERIDHLLQVKSHIQQLRVDYEAMESHLQGVKAGAHPVLSVGADPIDELAAEHGSEGVSGYINQDR